MKLIHFFPYRNSIGSNAGMYGSIPRGEVFIHALCQALGQQVDNHIGMVVSMHGEEFGFYWSDGKLFSVTKLVAGDCNKEHNTLEVLWLSK
jgi:hypothetical protein